MSLTPWTNPHPYLSGPYAPVATEGLLENLAVIGEIPRDLQGMYLRNSSNPRFPPTGRYHWFDGDGMLQCLAVEDGKASFRNRWVRTKAFNAETEAGKSLWRGVTERPDFTNPRGAFKDSANTDIVYHAGKLLALWWLGGEPYVIRLPDLETCGNETFGGTQRTFSAHPMSEVDPIVAELGRIGGARDGRTPSQVALAWIIAKGAVPIPGAKSAAQARENAGALGWALTADEITALDSVALQGQRTLQQRIWQHG